MIYTWREPNVTNSKLDWAVVFIVRYARRNRKTVHLGARLRKTSRAVADLLGRDGNESGVPESTPAGFCVCLSDPDSQSKICEKPDPDPESIFHFGSSRSLCGHFLSKSMGKFRLDR